MHVIRRLIPILFLTGAALYAVTGRAQQVDPAEAATREWQAESTVRDHLADALRGLIEVRKRESAAAAAALAEAEGRMTWVLRNCRDDGCW